MEEMNNTSDPVSEKSISHSEIPVTGNRFLDASFQAKSGIGNYLGSTTLSFLIWLLIGQIPITFLLLGYLVSDPKGFQDFLLNPSDLGQLPYSFNLVFSLIMAQFVLGIAGMWLMVKLFLKRPFVSVISGFPKFRVGRYFLTAGITLGLLGLLSLFMYLAKPDSFGATVNLREWAVFLPFALLLLPFQTAFEEFFFRGLLLQGLHRMLPRLPWASVLLSSIAFALLHSFNPEVGEFGFLAAMSSYFTMGLLLGFFAVADEGLEISAGLHFANNLFSFAILGYEGMVLPSPCLFLLKDPNPLMDVGSTLFIGGLLFFLLCRKNMPQLRVLFKGSIK